jgi:hypothetical protein
MFPVGTLVATFSRTQVLGGVIDVAGGGGVTAEIADERLGAGGAFRSTAALAARSEPRLTPSLLSPTRCRSRAPKSRDGRVPDTGGVGCIAAGARWPAFFGVCADTASAHQPSEAAAATSGWSASRAAIGMWFPFCARRFLKTPPRAVISTYGEAVVTVQSRQTIRCDLGHF